MNFKSCGIIRSTLTKKLKNLERMSNCHCGNEGAIAEMEQYRREVVDWVIQTVLKAHKEGQSNNLNN
jgi:hypothetical protein